MARGKAGREIEPFLFVNSGPTADAKDKPDRRTINAHSQRAFQRGRREQRAKNFRVALWTPAPPSFTQVESQLNTPDVQSEERASSSTASSPLSVLQKGNSDPFNTYAIPVDATVTSLLAFHHDCIIPSAYSLEITSVKRPAAANAAWSDATLSLQDECSAYGLLSSLATVIAAVAQNPAMLKRALIYRNTSSALLRYQVSKISNANDYSQLYGPILSLLAAEVASQNSYAASIHANMLARLIRRSGGLALVEPRFRMDFLWQDIHRSVMFLQRPELDFDEWVPLPYPEYEEPVKPSLMERVTNLAKAVDFNPSIVHSDLAAIFLDIRKTVEVVKWTTTKPKGAGDSSLIWAMTHAHVCIGRLMAHFVEAIRGARNSTNSHMGWNKLVQAYLCLAAVYWTRSSFGVAAVRIGSWLSNGGAVTHDTGLRILPALRELLRPDEGSLSAPFADLNPHARLWALYVGAIAEQRGAIRLSEEEQHDWFTWSFRRQADDLKLKSWHAVKQVLTTFLYSELVQPDGSIWFSKDLEDSKTEAAT